MLAIPAAGLLLAAACRKGGEPVLARVDGEPITEADLRRELQARPFASAQYLDTLPGRKELLELLVRRRLVREEAERAGFKRRPEVREKLAEVDAAFERQRDEARERVLVEDYFRHLQDADLKVTDQDVRDFWSKETEVRASHILFGDEAKARAALERLAKGEKFEALAAALSEDAATGKKGGDLGWLMRGTLVPEFEAAVFGLKTGQVSGVVPSPFGHHIIRKVEERALSATPYEKLAEKLRAVLQKKKFQEWIDASKKRHTVSTDLAALQDFKIENATPAAQPPKK